MTIDRSRIDEDNEIRLAWHESDLAHTLDVVARAGVDGEAVVAEVARFSAAAPSWAVGTGGTRFGRFPGGGEPRDHGREDRRRRRPQRPDRRQPHGEPARAVGRPRAGAGAAALRRHADERGIGFDAMNSNTFQDNPSTTGDGAVSYKFGCLANVDAGRPPGARSSTTTT